MPYKDKEKQKKSNKERKRRYMEKIREQKYGPNAGDMRGKHSNHRKGSSHPRWNGGKIESAQGYAKTRVGLGHPLADPNGYAYEHLLVWVSSGSKMPAKNEIIHHLNGDKTDNRIENLALMTRAEHNKLHNQEKGRNKLGQYTSNLATPNQYPEVHHAN